MSKIGLFCTPDQPKYADNWDVSNVFAISVILDLLHIKNQESIFTKIVLTCNSNSTPLVAFTFLIPKACDVSL